MKNKMTPAQGCWRTSLARIRFTLRVVNRIISTLGITPFLTAFCILSCIVVLSCGKSLNKDILPDPVVASGKIIRRIPKSNLILGPIEICITSYNQLVAELGSDSIPVLTVVLEDGTRITAEGKIKGMSYRAIDVTESNSLFRSELQIAYNLYGYQQDNISNSWSFGCQYINAGIPPFTNIIFGDKILLVNTLFFWNVPSHLGESIKYLIVE